MQWEQGEITEMHIMQRITKWERINGQTEWWAKATSKMEKTYVLILIILLGGVAQYNISDGNRISQYLHKLNICVCVLSSKNTTIGLHLRNTKEPTNNHQLNTCVTQGFLSVTIIIIIITHIKADNNCPSKIWSRQSTF